MKQGAPLRRSQGLTRKVSGRGAKRKGDTYELEVARAFADAGLGSLKRTPNSGGLHIKNDLRNFDGSFRVDGLAIECKRQETVRIWPWLAQAAEAARPTEIPVLAFRRSHDKSFACLPLDDLIGLLVEVAEAREKAA